MLQVAGLDPRQTPEVVAVRLERNAHPVGTILQMPEDIMKQRKQVAVTCLSPCAVEDAPAFGPLAQVGHASIGYLEEPCPIWYASQIYWEMHVVTARKSA